MNITVYCGASMGNNPVYIDAAKKLGEWIAANGHALVYGGGNVGLMGIIADTVLENGGEVIGVIPTFLLEAEKGHSGLHTLEVVESMQTRKARMIELGDAFIAMPGGLGTLEEIAEVISQRRLRLIDSPCVFYNIEGYYDMMKPVFDKMVANEFLPKEDLSCISYASNVAELSEILG